MRDVDIRRDLRERVASEHAGEPDTRVIDELGLCQGSVRVDVALVNGALHGYEIKSLRDTLRRLPRQVEVYSQVLDFSTIVLAEEHRADATTIVPAWWAVIVAKDGAQGVDFELARPGTRNECVDARALAELLWHDEALAMLRERGAERGCTSKPRRWAWDRLCEVYTREEIALAVRTRLKDRPRRQEVRRPP